MPVRLLVTSRPEVHVEDAFDSASDIARPYKMEDIPQKDAYNDIYHYLRIEVDKLAYKDELLDKFPAEWPVWDVP